MRWNKYEVSPAFPVRTQIRRPSSEIKFRVVELKTPRFSTAIGSNLYAEDRVEYYYYYYYYYSLSESRLFICNFRFSLHSDPFQYDQKKDLACVGDKSNCSIICTLFKIAFLGKWDERGEHPFL